MDTSEIEIVELHDGATEAAPLVAATMESLRHLLRTDPIAAFEAVEVARKPAHRPFGVTGETLSRLALTTGPDGGMHESVRAVIRNSAQGEGLELRLRSPIAPAPEHIAGALEGGEA